MTEEPNNNIDNPLAMREQEQFELATSQAAAVAQHEIQSAIIVARRFPRNEDQAFVSIAHSCKRPAFADTVTYKFPRGKRKDDRGNWVKNIVSGPSVYLAREAARIWGNIRHGIEIVRDDDDTRVIRAWAWDMQTNVKVSADDSFQKLVQRKNWESQQTEWVVPDERDLRELTNRRAAILVRNCILQLLPPDLVDWAIDESEKTMTSQAQKNPDDARRKLVAAFDGIGVSVGELEEYLQHPLKATSPKEIAELRQIYRSIRDGNSTWAEYVQKTERQAETGTLKAEDLKPSEKPNRGHGNENLQSLELTDEEKAEIAAKEAAETF